MKSGALSRADTGSKVSKSQNSASENTPLLSPDQAGPSYADVARHGTDLSKDTAHVASPATSSSASSTFRDSRYDGADDPVFPTHDQSDNQSQKANQSIGKARAFGVAGSLFVLIFLQAANMSGMTTLQSSIADSLDVSGSQALWFTSAYLIAMSSMAPLVGRLSQLFSPRYLVLVSASLFSCGGLITGLAKTYGGFVAGRVVSGVGGAGIMTLCLILVLELTGPKRRGLFIGLVNMGYTIGVSLGAVLAGASLGVVGWVSYYHPLFVVMITDSTTASTLLRPNAHLPPCRPRHLPLHPNQLQLRHPRVALRVIDLQAETHEHRLRWRYSPRLHHRPLSLWPLVAANSVRANQHRHHAAPSVHP